MKRATAFILSLTVIWLQMMASAQTLSPTAAEPACGCCAGQKVCRCCCVAPIESDAKAIPTVPVTTSTTLDFTAFVPKHVAWLLSASVPTIGFPAQQAFMSRAVPLFTRHCALLI